MELDIVLSGLVTTARLSLAVLATLSVRVCPPSSPFAPSCRAEIIPMFAAWNSCPIQRKSPGRDEIPVDDLHGLYSPD